MKTECNCKKPKKRDENNLENRCFNCGYRIIKNEKSG
jgi:DNA-directed RNA polymerase subunit RPC12/RpoP